MDTTTHLQQQITEVFENFITPLSSISHEIANAEPRQGSWTIAQLAQHMVLATAGVPDRTAKPATRSADQLEIIIRDTFLNYTEKFKSPQPLVPEKKNYELAELLTELKNNKEMVLHIIKEKDLCELCLDMELPGWGYLTRYEWIKLIIYHMQRHTAQLKKLKDSFSNKERTTH